MSQRGNQRQQTFFSDDDYRAYLKAGLKAEEREVLREHERIGRPLGDEALIEDLEARLGRALKKLKPGPKPKAKPLSPGRAKAGKGRTKAAAKGRETCKASGS